MLGGGEEGRGHQLAFDQKGEVMALLTSCFVSAQAQNPEDSFQAPSFFLVFGYCLPTAAQGLGVGVGNRTLFVVHPHDRLQNGNTI